MTQTYDVFLCYNPEDQSEVAKIAKGLKAAGLKPWFDLLEMWPGSSWQVTLEEMARSVKTIAVCVGPSGVGPWENSEVYALTREFIDRKSPVIPVILPGGYAPNLPQFFQGLQLVDFREKEPDPLAQLIWGITGNDGLDEGPILLEEIQLVNFRCFKDVKFSFGGGSFLGGIWNCVVGVNGAGKSSLLEAACLLLMGKNESRQLGENRLKRMCRNEDGSTYNARLLARIRQGTRRFSLSLDINRNGLEESQSSNMEKLWDQLGERMILSYGPTRNITEYRDTRYSSLSDNMQRQMTLFDPLAQMADVSVLLPDEKSDPGPVPKMLASLLDGILEDFDIQTEVCGSNLSFTMNGANITAVDLPDGFRSLASFLADLCTAWTQKSPKKAASGDPKEMEGIVLIDEIDLHLHAKLQRTIVPQLRKCLPKIQWIVTTHSPLVISGFDKNELILLDRREPGGVLSLKRQVLGMPVEQIYQWLMETKTRSPFIEDQLALVNGKRERRPEDDLVDEDVVASLLDESIELEEKEPSDRAAIRKAMLDKLDLDL